MAHPPVRRFLVIGGSKKMTEPNSLIKFWADGKSSVNAWPAINSPVGAEVMHKADWDTITIDCQHGMVDLGQAMTMIQTVAATGKITMSRSGTRSGLDHEVFGCRRDGHRLSDGQSGRSRGVRRGVPVCTRRLLKLGPRLNSVQQSTGIAGRLGE